MYPRLLVVTSHASFQSKMPLIQQNTHEFRNRHCRVRIVKLDRRFVGEYLPILVDAAKASNQIGK